MTQQNESIALFYQNEGSDKEYHVHLKSQDAMWIVEIQYGKRGSALRTALKTKSPIAYDEAKKAYDKIVRDQLKDGYTPSETGAAYQSTPKEKLFTGNIPQLLNPVAEEDFETYLKDSNYFLQEKFDGERLMLRKDAGKVEGSNRNGLLIATPILFEEALNSLPCKQCLLDNEWLGNRFACFDLLELDGVDLRPLPAIERKAKLDALLAQSTHEAFIHVHTATDEASKRALHDLVKSANGEGVVAKRADSVYKPGRPNSGGDQLKRKFVESCTLVVTGHHRTKRSISVGGYSADGALVELGSVTIPPNHEIPDIKGIVEVQYLYAYKDGSIYQPVYKGPRRDQGLEACVTSQLKYKSDGPATAAPKKSAPKP